MKLKKEREVIERDDRESNYKDDNIEEREKIVERDKRKKKGWEDLIIRKIDIFSFCNLMIFKKNDFQKKKKKEWEERNRKNKNKNMREEIMENRWKQKDE